jgi:hypothetical protein
MRSRPGRLVLACMLLALPSCMTLGLWSVDTRHPSTGVQTVEIRRDAAAERWWLRLPAPASSGGEWITVAPEKYQAAFAEVARIAALPACTAPASLSLRVVVKDAEESAGDDPWAALRRAGPDTDLLLRTTLPPSAIGELHWCEGVHLEVRDETLFVRVSSTCAVEPAEAPPPDLPAFPGGGAVSVPLPKTIVHRFGLGERLLMTPVTTVLDIVAIPFLPLAGLYFWVGFRYIKS